MPPAQVPNRQSELSAEGAGSRPAPSTSGEPANDVAAAPASNGLLPNGTAASHGSRATDRAEEADLPAVSGSSKQGSAVPLKGGRLAEAVVSEAWMPNGGTGLGNGTAGGSPLANGSVKPGKEAAAALLSNGHVTALGAAGAHAAGREL